MTKPDATALAVALVSLTVIFIRLRREYKRNLPRQNGEECCAARFKIDDNSCSGEVARYLFLEVWPARQARNAATACSRSSACSTYGEAVLKVGRPLVSCLTTPHNALPLIMHERAHSQQSRRENAETDGFALAPQTMRACLRGTTSSGLSNRRTKQEPRSDPAIIHPRFAA
jgi:hypothetical protein